MNSLPAWLSDPLARLFASRATLHHALLFIGPEGVGKEWLARSLAAALLCDQPASSGLACGQCASCRWMSMDSHPDFRCVRPSADEVQAEEGESVGTRSTKPSRDIRIEQIRGLAGFVEVASHRGGEKIVLITPADAMNTPTANALLKTLEEPAPNTRFLLVTSRVARLPATVRSRCRTVPVATPSGEYALDWLVKQTAVNPEIAREWLAFCGGAPRRAAEFATPEASARHRDLTEVFGGGDRLSLAEAADRLQSCEPRVWVPVLHAWCCDLARCRAGGLPRFFPGQARRLAELAGLVDNGLLLAFESWLQQTQRVVSHPLNARLVAEDAMIRYRAMFSRAAAGVAGRHPVAARA